MLNTKLTWSPPSAGRVVLVTDPNTDTVQAITKYMLKHESPLSHHRVEFEEQDKLTLPIRGNTLFFSHEIWFTRSMKVPPMKLKL